MADKKAIDIHIVQRIKQGDREAFKVLYFDLFSTLCAYANKFLQNREDAEEIVQELFLKLWLDRSRIDLDKSLLSYLFQSIHNNSLNQIEKEKVRTKYNDVILAVYNKQDSVNPLDSLIANELNDRIVNTIASLPPRCRKIFVMSKIEGKKYAEIAKELDLSVKTVETQIGRALKRLRHDLQDYKNTVGSLAVIIKMFVE